MPPSTYGATELPCDTTVGAGSAYAASVDEGRGAFFGAGAGAGSAGGGGSLVVAPPVATDRPAAAIDAPRLSGERIDTEIARLCSPCAIMIFVVAKTEASALKTNVCNPGSMGSARPSSCDVS